MSFYGYQFSFDGIPSKEFGLMVYDFGSPNENGGFSSTPTKIFEDRTARRSTPIHYGISQNTPLTYSFTFGADVCAIDKYEHIDRWDMDVVATWLTGHKQYKYLEIEQPDMEAVRYKCIITNLQYTSYGKLPWAFTCTVTCDSPFAYRYPETYQYNVVGTSRFDFRNLASTKLYYPKLQITVSQGSSFSLINHTDGDREFAFSDLSGVPIVIDVDNDFEVITNNKGLNLYGAFNKKFFRLVRGINDLEINATSASVKILCEFPINVGG